MKRIAVKLATEEQVRNDLLDAHLMIDELSSAALSLTSGPQAYTNFIAIRDEWKKKLVNLEKSYSILEVED